MKKMKKMMALVIAMVMVLAMGIRVSRWLSPTAHRIRLIQSQSPHMVMEHTTIPRIKYLKVTLMPLKVFFLISIGVQALTVQLSLPH